MGYIIKKLTGKLFSSVIGFFTPDKKELFIYLLLGSLIIGGIYYKEHSRINKVKEEAKNTKITDLSVENKTLQKETDELVNVLDENNQTSLFQDSVLLKVNDNVKDLMRNYNYKINIYKNKKYNFNKTIELYNKLFKESK